MINLPDSYDPKFPMDASTYLRCKAKIKEVSRDTRAKLYLVTAIFSTAFLILIIGLNLTN